MSSIFCAAMGVADMHVRYVNRRVLGNIEATNATRGHIHRYKHSPRRGTLSRSMWGFAQARPNYVSKIFRVHYLYASDPSFESEGSVRP